MGKEILIDTFAVLASLHGHGNEQGVCTLSYQCMFRLVMDCLYLTRKLGSEFDSHLNFCIFSFWIAYMSSLAYVASI